MTTPGTPQNEALNALVLTAMMQALDQQKRDELIKSALATLIAPRKADSGYHSKVLPSVLEEAFGNAVEMLARQLVNEMVRNDAAIRTHVQALCTQAVEKAFADSDDISTKMASAFTAALLKDRY